MTETSSEKNAQPSVDGEGKRSAGAWLGYGWFMTGGTFIPLPIFLSGYVINLSLIGAPLARQLYTLGLFLTTMGQPPPRVDRQKDESSEEKEEKESFIERVHRHSPPARLQRRGRPVSLPVRALWFVFVGWWLGALWVIMAWSVLLLPYPFLNLIRDLLNQLPSVMTLAYPESADPPAGSEPAVRPEAGPT